ncbi:MAG TPA: AraC family transcriptional regulator [Paraburkholderia sp.]|uniref:AraC family transcriptional regulator n=1 Tax=Paraburkholderia sp. TaxID=1926495 RepID=UPI002B4644DB|nr:AraC family transcriptional regulator [Paraburkholderia sp.]HKR44495.1 AraC family transcriptional regulator [Paraburkholderia sp.]
MPISAEQAADWLLSGLELRSTLFHVGRYCGAYRASTAGHQRASFHLVLEGACWLHLPAKNGRAAQIARLVAGDAVFLMHDMAHCLTPDSNALFDEEYAVRIGTMTPLDSLGGSQDSVALACGFFEFRSDLGEAVTGLLPDHILARRNDSKLAGARTLFDLIRVEAERAQDAPSPLINRLTDALFFYGLRAVASDDNFAPGLWSVMRRAEFTPLVTAIIEKPGDDWTTHTMAAFCHMSRARFCKQFAQACGQPPAQFLTLLRMKVAAEMLRHGASTLSTAERVGYQSESAFAQAFKRVTGLPPGTCRREPASIAQTPVH